MFSTPPPPPPLLLLLCVCECFLHKPSLANCTIKSLLHTAVVLGTTWPWRDSAVAMWTAGCLTHASHTLTSRLTREPSINLQSKIGTSLQLPVLLAQYEEPEPVSSTLLSPPPIPTPQLLILPPLSLSPTLSFPYLPPSSWPPPPPPPPFLSLFPTPSSHSVYIFAANLCY